MDQKLEKNWNHGQNHQNRWTVFRHRWNPWENGWKPKCCKCHPNLRFQLPKFAILAPKCRTYIACKWEILLQNSSNSTQMRYFSSKMQQIANTQCFFGAHSKEKCPNWKNNIQKSKRYFSKNEPFESAMMFGYDWYIGTILNHHIIQPIFFLSWGPPCCALPPSWWRASLMRPSWHPRARLRATSGRSPSFK